MNVAGFWPIFGLGCLGGFLVEIRRWWALREADDFPEYSKRLRYWFITLLMIVSGGFLATLYGITSRNAIMVVNLGAAAPALIAALSTKPPPGDDDVKGALVVSDTIRGFLSFGSTK